MTKTKNVKFKVNVKTFLVWGCLLFFSLYWILNSSLVAFSSVATQTVRESYMEDYVSAEGFVVRDRQSIDISSWNDTEYLVKQGEKVRKDQSIAIASRGKLNTKQMEKLAKIESNITEIKERLKNKEVLPDDINKLEQRIACKAEEIVLASYAKKARDVCLAKCEINNLMDKKDIAAGDGAGSALLLTDLLKEKEALEQSCNVNKTYLYAPSAGFFDALPAFSKLDLEQTMGCSPLDFEKIVNTVQERSNFGVIKNYGWSFVAVVPCEVALRFCLNDKVKLRICGCDKTVGAEVTRVSQPQDNKCLLVFNSLEDIEVNESQKLSVEVIKNTYYGLKIPNSALKAVNGSEGVYVVNGDTVKFKPVNILYRGKNDSIANEDNHNMHGLLLHDEVMVNSKNLENGKRIR